MPIIVLDYPPRSTDILVKNAIGDKIPTNKAVLYEYSFENCISPHGFNSGYYQWFLKNEHVLDGLRKYEGEKSDKSIADRSIPRIEVDSWIEFGACRIYNWISGFLDFVYRSIFMMNTHYEE
ncbi:hypothetical protein C1645_741098 [Glomus cerebriforme]|uniref:Uncharacterized protein n=1 Tax=Glomus cerebriforme TaxID=658196 RepID=A0A397STS7_9GLOM|nr:hypothetical protein C1645_741098 [Glomus cerebriforme]